MPKKATWWGRTCGRSAPRSLFPTTRAGARGCVLECVSSLARAADAVQGRSRTAESGFVPGKQHPASAAASAELSQLPLSLHAHAHALATGARLPHPRVNPLSRKAKSRGDCAPARALGGWLSRH
eukprot:72750-Chlamydomonas_euryale.AAC.3